VITHVCLLVGSFVSWFVTLVLLSRIVPVQFLWNLAQTFSTTKVRNRSLSSAQGQSSLSKPPYWKSWKRNISAVVWDIFTKFGNPTDIGLSEVISAWNITFDKIQDGGPAEVCTLWQLSSCYSVVLLTFFFAPGARQHKACRLNTVKQSVQLQVCSLQRRS